MEIFDIVFKFGSTLGGFWEALQSLFSWSKTISAFGFTATISIWSFLGGTALLTIFCWIVVKAFVR